MNSPPLLFSDEVQYGCTLCGECCREQWRVPVEESARLSLRERDWSATPLAEQAKANPEFFIQEVPTLKTKAAFRTQGGACVLLNSSGLCQAHRLYGPEAKGVVCRLFPYLFVEAPEATYTGYSFCCRPVRRPKELEQAKTILKESPFNAYKEAKGFFPGIHYQVAPASIILGSEVEILWDDYLELESGLLELLSRSRESLRFNLVAGHIYLTLAEWFLREFKSENQSSRSDKVHHFLKTMRDENYARVDRMVRKVKSRKIVRRYVLSVMLSLHETGRKAREKRDRTGKPGMISRLSLMRSMIGQYFARYPKTDLPEDLFSELVGRYLRHVIWRKGLAMGRSLYRLGGLTREYAMLLVSYALIEYYARRFASRMEAEEAICEAIRQVERDFVLHAGRDEIGPDEEERDTFELFLGLFDSMVHSKTFAPSIVGWKGSI